MSNLALPSLNIAPPSTVEMSLVHAIAFRAFRVIKVIDSENLMISQVVLRFDSEKRFPAHLEMLLKSDQCTDILVVVPDVIEQSDDALTVHSCLYAQISHIKRVLAQPVAIIS